MPVARNTKPLLPPLPGVDADRTLSSRHAVLDEGVHGDAPPRDAMSGEKPTVGYAVEYVTSELLMALRDPTAEASFAAIRARNRLGIAMAAMIRIIATTISNSMSENPLFERI